MSVDYASFLERADLCGEIWNGAFWDGGNNFEVISMLAGKS